MKTTQYAVRDITGLGTTTDTKNDVTVPRRH